MAKFDIVDGKLIKCKNGSSDNGHIVIPKGCYEIGSNVIDLTTMVRSIEIPDDVVVIHPSAFAHCSYLESVTLPSSLEVIGSSAFACCRALREIKLPPWLEKIGSNAFQSCTALEKINIPASVRYVGRRAFLGCHDLTVTRCGSTEGWDEYWDHIATDPAGLFKKERLYYVDVIDRSEEYGYYLRGNAYFDKNGDRSISAAQAYSCLKRAAEAGIEEAYFSLGNCYVQGVGVAKDLKQAAKWFEKALNTNAVPLLVRELSLADCYYQMDGSAELTQRAITLIQSALSHYDVEGDPYNILSTIYHKLGDCYFNDCIKDYDSSLRYFELAANLGDTKAQLEAALLYQAKKTPEGEKKAQELFLRAAEAGNNDAAWLLGEMYTGQGTATSYEAAEKWLLKAAEAGHRNAQVALVNIYIDIESPLVSSEKAIPWLEKLVAAGEKKAAEILEQLRAIVGRKQAREEYRLYERYLYGFDGYSRDHKKAFEYLESAAAAGLPRAQYTLGLCYYRGDWSYPKNAERAIELWEKAAKQDDSKAKIQLEQLEHIRKKAENRAKTQALQEAARKRKAEAAAKERAAATQEPVTQAAASAATELEENSVKQRRLEQLQALLRAKQKPVPASAVSKPAAPAEEASTPPAVHAPQKVSVPTPAVKKQEAPTPVVEKAEPVAPVKEQPKPQLLTEEERREQRYDLALKAYYGADGVTPDLKHAFEEFQALAAEGHTAARTMQGVCYNYGHGVAKDVAAAYRCFEDAAQKNDPDALYHLSYRYRWGEGVAKDEARAAELMRRAAELGSCQAFYSLSQDYCFGYSGCAKDMAQSQLWFEKIRPHAEAGDLQAQYMMGAGHSQYLRTDCGRDRAEDEKQALLWLTKAAERGHRLALFNLAGAYKSGAYGAERSIEKAMLYYEKAGERGDVIATSRLADLYYKGVECPQNYKKAAEFYSKGVTSHDKAMLASCYLYGYGVEPDPARAIALSREAVEQKWCPVPDKAVGYENLAYCYHYGKGTVRDLSRARTYYKNAAVCGSVNALCTLGDAYYNGNLLLARDLAEAKKYYQKAAEKGSEYAASMLKKI